MAEGSPTAELAYARVAVPVPLGQGFTYRIPAKLAGSLLPGSRVLCPFGRRRVLAVVLSLSAEPPADVPLEKLKDVEALVDEAPVLPAELLAFLRELARYYIAPIGEVLRLALPAVEREASARLEQQGLALGGAGKAVGRLVLQASAVEAPPTNAAAGLKGQAKDILAALKADGPTTIATLGERWGNARAAVKRLVEQGLVVTEKVPVEVDPFAAPVEPDVPPELNGAQQVAVDALVGALEAPRGDPSPGRAFLLHGVTGSGKTEVYLRVAERCLARAGGAIILVPEIALTPQLSGRFKARLGEAVAVLHSGLTEAARHSMWRRVRSGELRVVVGARSALFAPVADLQLLCVDEEHDGSFKQEEGVRYHARDMALLRAHRAEALCILGSATPSLESEHLVSTGRVQRLSLPDRAHARAVLPEIETVDLRRIGPGPSGDKLISVILHGAIEKALAAKEQVILFLNRRGFAPNVICEGCGELLQCPDCAVGLTHHQRPRERLNCHYCGFTVPRPERCPKCQSNKLAFEGTGTERIESLLGEHFPAARVARLDRDVAGGAKSEAVLSRMRTGEVDILIGTQMVTKGHDLPAVTLVGVLNADSALSLPDFRASERTFQQLVQVAGRAGRAGKKGRVVVQTRNPDDKAIALALTHDVQRFVEAELKERKELLYPPFSRLAMVRVNAADEDVARRTCEEVAALARRHADPSVQLLGPTAAPLAKLRNRYRFRFMLRARDRRQLRTPLLAVARFTPDRRARVAVDVDPVSML